MAIERTPARIGLLYFKYEDPAVNVDTEAEVVEQTTIDDSIIVQQIGRAPDQITLNAVVADFETQIVDDLTKNGVVTLRTERWQGKVIVKSTTTDFMRARDSDGNWLYECQINCLEVYETTQLSGAPGAVGTAGGGPVVTQE